MEYNHTTLRQHTTAQLYQRGQDLCNEVIILTHTMNVLEGWVGDHLVELTQSALGPLVGVCTCQPEHPFLCEHSIALSLYALMFSQPDIPTTLDELETDQFEHLLRDVLQDDQALHHLDLLPLHMPEEPHTN